jgi:hypothetical protein
LSKLRPAFIVSALAVLLGPQILAEDYKLKPHQWSIARELKTNTAYAFRNLVNGKRIAYGERMWGINLEWTSSGAEWVFRTNLPSGVWHPPTGPTSRGNPRRDHVFGPNVMVGIFNTTHKHYLVHDSRFVGVDLGWSREPKYEWKAERNPSGEVSLYNTSARDYVVHGVRGEGINLQWLAVLKRATAANAVGSVHKATVWMNAQPVVQGYVPFLGTYGGGGTKSVLTKVTNAQPNVQLNFLKPGYRTDQCGQPGATIALVGGHTMTDDQMRTVWGSATPSLGVALPFLACAVGTNARTVLVNIERRITD